MTKHSTMAYRGNRLKMPNRLLIGALALLLSACSDTADEPVQTATSSALIEVTTQTLKSQNWQGQIKTFGVVEAAEEITLSLDFSGIIKTVLVNEGERVQQGMGICHARRRFTARPQRRHSSRPATGLRARRPRRDILGRGRLCGGELRSRRARRCGKCDAARRGRRDHLASLLACRTTVPRGSRRSLRAMP